MTQRRAIENYFTEDAIREVCGPQVAALDHYESLKTKPDAWSKSQRNWQIASRMTREDFEDTDIGKFLVSVLEAMAPASAM